jgi:hypothetical protein
VKVFNESYQVAVFRGLGAPKDHEKTPLSEARDTRVSSGLATLPTVHATGTGPAGLFLWRVASHDDRDLVFQSLPRSSRARFAR